MVSNKTKHRLRVVTAEDRMQMGPRESQATIMLMLEMLRKTQTAMPRIATLRSVSCSRFTTRLMSLRAMTLLRKTRAAMGRKAQVEVF